MFVEHKEVGETKELDAASKTLLRAAELLERDGWCQGAYFDGNSACTIGALMDAAADIQDRNAAIYRLKDALDGWNIFNWNDAPGRTKEEVVAKLRAVAFHRV